jgi:hypothetical protein
MRGYRGSVEKGSMPNEKEILKDNGLVGLDIMLHKKEKVK